MTDVEGLVGGEKSDGRESGKKGEQGPGERCPKCGSPMVEYGRTHAVNRPHCMAVYRVRLEAELSAALARIVELEEQQATHDAAALAWQEREAALSRRLRIAEAKIEIVMRDMEEEAWDDLAHKAEAEIAEEDKLNPVVPWPEALAVTERVVADMDAEHADEVQDRCARMMGEMAEEDQNANQE